MQEQTKGNSIIPAGKRTLPSDPIMPIRYVALGDSTVYGMGASSQGMSYVSRLLERLREAYPQAQLTNLGVNGATSNDVVARQLRQAVTLRPDLVTLSIGPNDIMQGMDMDQYERNIATILRTLNNETTAVVVVNSIPDLAVTPVIAGLQPMARMAISSYTAMFNDVLRHAAGVHAIDLVDLYGPSQEHVPQHRELVSNDGFHPSDYGYARWADLMWQEVARHVPFVAA